MKELIEHVEIQLFRLGLVAEEYHVSRMTSLGEASALEARHITNAAVQQALIDMFRAGVSQGFDEEHLTASFAGSLASNLHWFARAYRDAKGEDILPSFRWVYQSRSAEARSGFDFGLLVDAPPNDRGARFRIALFQAKVCDDRTGTVDISHITKGHPKNGLPMSTDAMGELIGAAAAIASDELTLNNQLISNAKKIAHEKLDRTKSRYQFETMLRTDFRGQYLTGSIRKWCFYLAWHERQLPSAEEVRAIAVKVSQNSGTPKLGKMPLTDSVPSLAILLDEVMHSPCSEYGLEFEFEQADLVVDAVLELSPTLCLLLGSDDHRLVNHLRSKPNLRMSRLLIPENLIDPDFAQRIGAVQNGVKRGPGG